MRESSRRRIFSLAQERGTAGVEGVRLRNRRRPVERCPALLIRHLEEKQLSQLLDLLAIWQPVVPQDAELLDDLGGTHRFEKFENSFSIAANIAFAFSAVSVGNSLRFFISRRSRQSTLQTELLLYFTPAAAKVASKRFES